MADESHIEALDAVQALERAVAVALERFEALPDAFVREPDLVGYLAAVAYQDAALRREVVTADGHRTPLLHLYLPPFAHAARGLPETYPVALLHPGFAHSQPLAIAGNLEGQGTRYLLSQPPAVRRRPLLAVLDVRLVDGLTPASISQLIPAMNAIARSEDQAYYRLMMIFCRNWDLDAHIRRTLAVFEQWAELHPQVPLLVAQSHRDDIGGVFGARYLNHWTHMAPLDPL